MELTYPLHYQGIHDGANTASRRKYVRSNKRKFGCWHCVRLSEQSRSQMRNEAFLWCGDIQHPWGTDSSRRRFYFSNTGDAVLFKLTWGGNFQ